MVTYFAPTVVIRDGQKGKQTTRPSHRVNRRRKPVKPKLYSNIWQGSRKKDADFSIGKGSNNSSIPLQNPQNAPATVES